MHVVLDDVPLRDATLSPEEILMSESQERMCAIVEPVHLERFLEICAKWDVSATVIGEVTDGDRLVIEWHGETVVDVPPRTVAHEGPVYDRPYARPSWQDALQADAPSADRLSRPATGDELRATVLRMAASPNLAGKAWVTDQYDRYVQGNTVLAQPDDAGVLRLDEQTGLGVALSTDGNGRFCKLDPYAGVPAGARRGLPQRRCDRGPAARGHQLPQLRLARGPRRDVAVRRGGPRGLADGCLELGIPVTGGNVSFYNQTGDADPADPGHRRARRHRRRRRAYADGPVRYRRPALPPRPDA